MAGFGQILGGAMAGIGTGMVQMAQLQWQSALANLERQDRKAEREEDRIYQRDEWTRRDEISAKRDTEKDERDFGQQKELLGQQQSFQRELQDRQDARSAASEARADARAAADRAARGAKDAKPDETGVKLRERIAERYTGKDDMGQESTDWNAVTRELMKRGYDADGVRYTDAPREPNKRKAGFAYNTPSGLMIWEGNGWRRPQGLD